MAASGNSTDPALVNKSPRESGVAPLVGAAFRDTEVAPSSVLDGVEDEDVLGGGVIKDDWVSDVCVGRTTVTEMGGAELTTSELGGGPVPCGSSGL